MSCTAVVRHYSNVAILDVAGRIVLGEGSGLVRNTIKDLVETGERRIVLNLKGVSYIDSAGLGELVSSYATVRNQGGDIRLANVPDKLGSLLQITKLYTIFPSYASEVAAVESFSAKAAGS